MLIKEYRIALPMSLGEYQVAQLYMIQKKSREESSGEGSGVQILENRPYSDGPGGCGQFTHKVYHVGSHIPGWFRALLPKAALQVEEESWNAYPYTRTRYTCPFVEKFSIDIETYYKPDCGDQANVFNLVSGEKRQRIVDMIDIVRDSIPPTDYKPDEDPKLYRSVKTARGPLSDSWIEERRTREGQALVMCAYKLCKVEFRYWGMQSKIEQFIHDIGLRRVMLRAHRQAWCWQDEWCDLSMEEIRALEEETARTLAQRMGRFGEEPLGANGESPGGTEGPRLLPDPTDGKELAEDALPKQWSLSSRSSHSSQHAGAVTQQSLSEWRMQNIARDSENSSEEEFFDAHEDLSDSDEVFAKEITKWSSNDFIDKAGSVGEGEDRQGETSPGLRGSEGRPPPCSMDARSLSESISSENISQSCKIHVLTLILHGGNILDSGAGDPGSKGADLSTLTSVFDTVTRVHFPEALGHMESRLVPCPPLCCEALALVAKLSPYGYEDDGLSSSPDQIPLAALPLLATSSAQYREVVAGVVTRSNQAYSEFLRSEEGTNFKGQVCLIGDCVGGIVGFDALCNIAGSPASSRRGSVNTERLSPEILIDSDPLANPRLEGTRQLSKSNNELSMGTSLDSQRGSPRKHSNSSTSDIDSMKQHHTFLSTLQANVLKGDGGLRRTSSSSMINLDCSERFDFDVSDFFLFGCPLGLVLALRKMVAPGLELSQFQPACQQIYNLFHPADPLACRLEPLLTRDFHLIPPFVIPRYQKFPLGDGNSSLLVDTLQSFTSIFSGVPEPSSTTTLTPALGDLWRPSDHSSSGEGGLPQPGSPIPCDVARVIDKWWGSKRIDYALYCPDALTAFPTVTLPHLFHASYWESTDVVAFILRQVMRQQNVELEQVELETSDFCPPLPQEKWLRKRTQVKIRQNVASNHRATDVVAVVGAPQVLSGRFTYGPLDVVTLTGEKVDVYIMTEPPLGKWIQCGTETTNSSGRITCLLPQDKRLPLGMYPVRMFVRGDHTYGECYLSVLPKGTECVVFSIDGSFAASVSIMGSDPKVRAGAVDVVRHWQDRGYLIVYVTGRPDMQKQKVVAWLSQHNFPHGIVSFCDGLVHDPLRQKTAFLQNLVQEAEMKIEAAYGSTKDISVYGLLRIPAQYTYIVGRPSKKWFGQCQFLTEGYVTHLAQLEGRRISVTPTTNARAALAKGSFGGAGRGHFPRPPVAPSPPGRCRSEKGGSGGTSERGPKPRSISLKFDSEP